MDRKTISIIITSFIIFSGFFIFINFETDIATAAKTVYVGGIGPGNYSSIQSALNAANTGDTVYVYDEGSPYFENLVINKQLYLVGENKATTVINGGGSGDVISINSANSVEISGFAITNGDIGIWVFMSSNTIIKNNDVISNNNEGIGLYSSTNTLIQSNNVVDNWHGISAESDSDNNHIDNNNISNNDYGIWIWGSSNIEITNNSFLNDGVFLRGDQLSHFNTHTISTDNLVNGKPLFYFKNSNNIYLDSTMIGQLILANCDNCDFKNHQIENTDVGIELVYSSNISISGCDVLNNRYGLWSLFSSDNDINNNKFNLNEMGGLYLTNSSNNDYTSNELNYNLKGISETSSSNNMFKGNTIISNSQSGIHIRDSNYNLIEDNYINSNTKDGILVEDNSNYNVINKNDIGSNDQHGISFYDSPGNFITNNMISTNLYYGIQLESFSYNNNIIGNDIQESEIGLYVRESAACLIRSNNVSTSLYEGIQITWGSDNCNITYNNISENKCGISVSTSNNNIFHNNIIDNTVQAEDYKDDNTWYDDYPSGGNYWSDYTGLDERSGIDQNYAGGDGIGDSSYKIGGIKKDKYPLMTRFPQSPRPPSSPKNIHISSEGEKITLTWEPPAFEGGSPVTNYRVYKGTIYNQYTFYQELDTQLFFIDTDVSYNVTYYYKLTAVNSIGESDKSYYVHVTLLCDPIPPFAPQNFTAVVNINEVLLAWSEPVYDGGSPITSYKIYRGTTSGPLPFFTEIGTELSFNDINVSLGETLKYCVSAENDIGEGKQSNIVSVQIPDKPLAPQNLVAEFGLSYVNLSWDAPVNDGGSPITNYLIYKNKSTGAVGLPIKIGNVTYYNDTNVENGVIYYYQVSALNIIGESPKSNKVSVIPGEDPSHPFDILVTEGLSYIILNWSAPERNGGFIITNYIIYKGMVSGEETFFKQIGNITYFNDTEVLPDLTYYYKISAVNLIGEGPTSNSISGTPFGVLNKFPEITIIYPNDGEQVWGIIVINGTASDVDGTIQKVEIKIDTEPWVTLKGTTSWNYTWDTTYVTRGKHTILARCGDELYDFSLPVSITFYVVDEPTFPPDPKPEDESSDFYIWAISIIIIVIVMVILISILLFVNKKKSTEPEKPKHSVDIKMTAAKPEVSSQKPQMPKPSSPSLPSIPIPLPHQVTSQQQTPDSTEWQCSKCGKLSSSEYHFCPYCYNQKS